MKVRPSAIIIKDNKLLTLRYIYNENEIYAIPGGNLEFGEKLEDTLVRELEEELGLGIEVGGLIFLAEVHHSNKDTLHCIFESKIISGTPVLNPKETTALEACWIPFEQLENRNLYPNIKSQIIAFCLGDRNQNVFLGEIAQPWF